MKYSLILILFIPLFSFAQSELSSMLNDVNNLGKSSDEQCTPMDYQKCASDLCGPPDQLAEKNMANDNGLESYNAKKYGDLETVKMRIQKILKKNQKKNQDLINQTKLKLSKIVQKRINDTDPSLLDRDAREVFEKHIKISVQNGEISIVPLASEQSDSQFFLALADYSVSIKKYFERYPYELKEMKLINSEELKILNNKIPDEHYVPGNLCNSSCKKIISENLQKTSEANLKKIEIANNDPVTLENMFFKCTSNYISYANANDKAEEFKKLLPGVKSSFLEKAMVGFSEHSRKKFSHYLDNNLAFDFGLISPEEALRKSEKSILGTSEEKLQSNLFYEPSIELYEDIPVCESQSDTYLRDAFVKKPAVDEFDPQGYIAERNNSDTVVISRKTCRFHASGIGVIAHEIGHSLSHVFKQEKLSSESYQQFMSLRQCLNKSHPEQKAAQFPKHAGDETFTEEDTADYFAYKTYADQDLIGMCYLLIPKGDKYWHISGNVMEVVRPSSTKQGPHTPSFVRVLREALYKKKQLPSTCRNVVKEYRETYKDKNLCI